MSAKPQQPESRSYRVPQAPVWDTVTRVTRRDPKTGKTKKVKVVIVRWRTPEGKVREKRFDEALAAEKFKQKKLKELRRSLTHNAHNGSTLSEWADAYLASRFEEYRAWKRGDTDNAGHGYAGMLKMAVDRFIERIGDRRLDDYRASDFERFRSEVLAEGKLRKATVEGYLQRIRTIFRAAYKDGLVEKPVTIEVQQFAYEKPVIEREQIEEVFEAAKTWPAKAHKGSGSGPGRMLPILMTLYYTMMRRGELAHLTWQDLRSEDGKIVELLIQPKEWREGGETRRWEPKDREVRAIPVHPRLAEQLQKLRRRRAHRHWVFVNGKGERWKESSLASLMHRFCAATGFEIGFHMLRRSGITHLHDAEAPIDDVKKIAGHASVSTTMKYIRSSSKGQRKTILKLE